MQYLLRLIKISCSSPPIRQDIVFQGTFSASAEHIQDICRTLYFLSVTQSVMLIFCVMGLNTAYDQHMQDTGDRKFSHTSFWMSISDVMAKLLCCQMCAYAWHVCRTYCRLIAQNDSTHLISVYINITTDHCSAYVEHMLGISSHQLIHSRHCIAGVWRDCICSV